MQKRSAIFGLMLLAVSLACVATARAQRASEKLRSDEYDTVALIYNEELAALGKRALYPICIGVTSGTPIKPLLQYLRGGGYEVSNPSLCEPAMLPGGQHHPKDYTHGLRIFIDEPQRDPGGLVSIHVQTDDLTVRPGDHFARTLRRGTYHLKQTEKGEWHVSSYTNEYDSAKDEKQGSCNVAESALPNR
jgi:hypothetical protein